MNGQLWLSLFRVREGDHPDREPGVYGVALVSYEDPSPLTYSELLVARRLQGKVNIVDIWVDSADSRDGGRELWAIPKGLCDFTRRTEGGLVQRTTWETSLEGAPIASARFTDVSTAGLRTPFKGATLQTRPESHPQAGDEVVAHLSGSAKTLPAHGSWSFHPDGPLGWLAGKRSLASARMADFEMSFG
jgi:acetoacetate decarboxylase